MVNGAPLHFFTFSQQHLAIVLQVFHFPSSTVFTLPWENKVEQSTRPTCEKDEQIVQICGLLYLNFRVRATKSCKIRIEIKPSKTKLTFTNIFNISQFPTSFLSFYFTPPFTFSPPFPTSHLPFPQTQKSSPFSIYHFYFSFLTSTFPTILLHSLLTMIPQVGGGPAAIGRVTVRPTQW